MADSNEISQEQFTAEPDEIFDVGEGARIVTVPKGDGTSGQVAMLINFGAKDVLDFSLFGDKIKDFEIREIDGGNAQEVIINKGEMTIQLPNTGANELRAGINIAFSEEELDRIEKKGFSVEAAAKVNAG